MPPPILLPRTEFEDRTPFYEDVRSLLTPGFLTEVVTIGGHRFALRTFTTEDFFLLRCRAGSDAPDFESKAWAIASAIWMVDGQIVHGHQESLLRIFQMCRDMSLPMRDGLYRVLVILTRRMQEATLRAEAYLYESESRFLWKGEGGRLMEHPPIRVGVNKIQHLWSFYNTIEDQREDYQNRWSLTKFIAGTQAPKGIQKLNAKEQKTEAELEQKRQRVRDRMFYEASGLPFPTEEESRKFYNVNPMETEEDLKKEMARWLKGEKDWHDRIIDFVKNKIRRSVEERRVEEVSHENELERILEEERSSLEVLSPEMARELLQRTQGPKRVLQDTTHNSAYDKYLAQDPIAGYMEVDAEQGVPKPKNAPDEEMLKHLQERVLHAPVDPQTVPEEDLRRYLDNHPPRVGK